MTVGAVFRLQRGEPVNAEDEQQQNESSPLTPRSKLDGSKLRKPTAEAAGNPLRIAGKR